MSILTEWWVQDRIREQTSGLAKSYEVDALRGDVHRLELSLREARSEADGLRNELQALRQEMNERFEQLLPTLA